MSDKGEERWRQEVDGGHKQKSETWGGQQKGKRSTKRSALYTMSIITNYLPTTYDLLARNMLQAKYNYRNPHHN